DEQRVVELGHQLLEVVGHGDGCTRCAAGYRWRSPGMRAFVALPDNSRRQLTPLEPLVRAIESAEFLDPVAEQVGKAVRGVLSGGPIKDALSGTWLGHAVHPMLTDVVIGSFTAASLLDLLAPGDDGRASERLIALGLAAYLPTAVAGANDWADSESVDDAIRRVGIVHSAGNAIGATLYSVSLRVCRRGARGRE